MANKYVSLVLGKLKEVAAIVSSAGAGDSGKIIALDTDGRINSSLMPVGIGADTKSILSSENLSAGDFVNVWLNSAVANVRKADATGAGEGKKAHGFVLAAVTSPGAATVYFEGTNTQLTSLTPGATYFLSTTPGQAVTTAPSATGNIQQAIGVAISATEINFEMGIPIEVA